MQIEDDRNGHLEASRSDILTGFVGRDANSALCCSETVPGLSLRSFITFVELGSFSSLEINKVRDSVEDADSVSDLPSDFVGEGGRGTPVGMRLSQFMASVIVLETMIERGCEA